MLYTACAEGIGIMHSAKFKWRALENKTIVI